MALILNIDSSSPDSSVTIALDGSMLQHLTNPDQKDHAAFVHLAVKEVLKRQNILASSLDAVAVTSGPGSYTGLRVGFAAAKGLSYALNKPLISISSTEVMAKAVWMAEEQKADYYIPMIDARRDEVFTATFNSYLEEIKPPHAMIVTAESFENFPRSSIIYYFGSGAEKLKKLSTNPNAFFPKVVSFYTAFSVLSFRNFSEKKFADIVRSVPIYGKQFYNS